MSTKHYKTLVTFLTDNDFIYSRTNSKSVEVYEHPTLSPVLVSFGISERATRNVIRDLQKTLGHARQKDKSKRSATAVKDRHAAERSRLREEEVRSRMELEELVRRRETRMDGLGGLLSERELGEAVRLIEAKERRLREVQRLMHQIPSTNEHAGRVAARHRS
ncbi:hypothetical protein AS850_02950 [Frondihabitans sp. 762G35]|uniref:hypothetical protein n=1 Tax=Frondihabitans sp. 762G35 TaxID=1446794 RepID=UPI000D203915|nr:hypothetical protein [Frondihabitans sp. 762G35]ARC56031.1 hypothetical protein AS850_02950 [Frondihabitans sp. 762G35]